MKYMFNLYTVLTSIYILMKIYIKTMYFEYQKKNKNKKTQLPSTFAQEPPLENIYLSANPVGSSFKPSPQTRQLLCLHW